MQRFRFKVQSNARARLQLLVDSVLLYTYMFVWAMVGWVTLPFCFLKASVLCTCISVYILVLRNGRFYLFYFKPVCYAPVYTLYLYCVMGDFSYVKADFLFAAKGVVVH